MSTASLEDDERDPTESYPVERPRREFRSVAELQASGLMFNSVAPLTPSRGAVGRRCRAIGWCRSHLPAPWRSRSSDPDRLASRAPAN
jgi:hypothetical protein